nr:E3 ubiquitin-protein ligase MIB2-like isoform X3 [Pocillopora verrucosa]
MTINLLGTRVVRGQDWEWGNQDGGEGFVGTVVQVGRDKKSPVTEQLVYVQWDCGGKHNYRAGIEKKHDLRIFSFTNGDAKHLFRNCDGCKEDPIIGLRWHCLDCPNYDLCSKCYMNDIHDVNHRFERFDKSRAKGIPVGKRQGATQLEARGMFKGAKVTRGPDWEWKEQDNQSPTEGEVTEVTSWSDETNNDAVRVNWNKGPRGDIYRLGKNGKVDLKCTSSAVGGYYYRDHLPPLTMRIRKSKSGFTTGDKVYLQKLAVVKLQELSAGHGGWNADMERYIGKIGVVQDFTTDGDVVVEYRDRSWCYNPAALTKIQKFKQGDEVVVKSDEHLVKELQKEHGGWNESMISILGRTGKVLEVDSDGGILVSVEGTTWMLSPAAVTSVTDPDPQQSTVSGDMGSEDPLGLFSLQRQAHEQEDRGLVNAAQSNNLLRLKEILDANPERIDELVDGRTALHEACYQGHCDIIRELLERGADMEILDDQGYTAMHVSTYQDESGEALKLLLERGFDPNVQHGSNKNTPLHWAVQKKNETAVQILTQCPECDVNLQDEDGDTPLHDAILLEHHNMVDMLLDCPRICYTLCNGKGFNYLHLAVLKGNKRGVERIFAKTGNSLNVVKDDGFTTLHIAANNDHREIAKILLKKPGCEVDAPSAENHSALHLAANAGHSVMVELLLDFGANVNSMDNDGDTALHISLMREHELQSNPRAMYGPELLPGIRKSSASFVAVSRCLLNYGADVWKVNGSGETPLTRCRGSEVEQLIRKIAACGRTTDNKKVPSFGSSSESQTEPESEDASSSASAATPIDETEKDDKNQPDSTSSTDEGEDTFLRRLISALCSGDQQESVSEEMSDEMKSEDVQEGETTESVSQETALNVVLEVTNKVAVETWASDISNNSVVQPAEMAENNTDTDMDDSEGPQSQTQSTDDDVNMDQETENEEKNPSTSDDLKVLCNICEEAEAVVAFKPCGHTVVCTECAARLKRCLDCKTPITGKRTRDGNPIIGINNKSLLSRYQQLEAKFRKLEEFVVCCICVERKKDVIFRCGHGTCQFCAKQLSICHICQKPIEMKIQMF